MSEEPRLPAEGETPSPPLEGRGGQGRRLLRGLLEGAFVSGLTWAGWRLFGPPAGGPAPATAAAAAALVVALCGLSRMLTGHAVGAVAGLAVGGLIGLEVAGRPPANYVPPGAHIGKSAKISGPLLGGGHYDSTKHLGKVVVVDFWATWCVPCLREMPELKEMYRQLKDEGLEIVGVSHDRNENDLARYVKDEKVPWPHIIYPADENTGRRPNPNALAYDVDGIPYTLVLGREGTVVAQGVRGPELRRAVERALRPAGDEAGDLSGRALVGLFLALGGLAGAALEWSLRQPGEAPK